MLREELGNVWSFKTIALEVRISLAHFCRGTITESLIVKVLISYRCPVVLPFFSHISLVGINTK